MAQSEYAYSSWYNTSEEKKKDIGLKNGMLFSIFHASHINICVSIMSFISWLNNQNSVIDTKINEVRIESSTK